MFGWKDDMGHNDYDPEEPVNKPTLADWIVIACLIFIPIFFLGGLAWLIHKGFSTFI